VELERVIESCGLRVIWYNDLDRSIWKPPVKAPRSPISGDPYRGAQQEVVMSNKFILFVFGLLMLLTTLAYPQSIQQGSFHPGFFDGNKYLKLSSVERGCYVSGIIDGFFGAPLIQDEASTPVFGWLQPCIGSMTILQVKSIIDKYMQTHPEQWHYPMNGLVFNAIFEICPKR
jgi:hypothetical protein